MYQVKAGALYKVKGDCLYEVKGFLDRKLASYLIKFVFLYRLHAGSGVKTAGTAIGKEFLWRCGTPNIKKAYITRFVLDHLKPEKFQTMSGNTATIDAHGYVINMHLLN